MKVRDTLVAQRSQSAHQALADGGVLDIAQFKALKEPRVTQSQLEIAGAMVDVAKEMGFTRGTQKKLARYEAALKVQVDAQPMLERAEVLHDAGLLTDSAFRRLGDGKVSKISLAEVAFAKKKAATPDLKQAASELMSLAQDAHDQLPWLSQVFEGWVERRHINSDARTNPAKWAQNYTRIASGEAEL